MRGRGLPNKPLRVRAVRSQFAARPLSRPHLAPRPPCSKARAPSLSPAPAPARQARAPRAPAFGADLPASARWPRTPVFRVRDATPPAHPACQRPRRCRRHCFTLNFPPSFPTANDIRAQPASREESSRGRGRECAACWPRRAASSACADQPASRDGTPPWPPGSVPEGGCSPVFCESASGGGRGSKGAEVAGEALPVRRSVCHAVSQSRCQLAAKGDSPSCQTPQLPPSVSPSPDFNPGRP